MTVLYLDAHRGSPDRPGSPLPRRRRARRSPLAHQCTSCGEYWSMAVVRHPAGTVLLCRHCGALRRSGVHAVADVQVAPPVPSPDRPG